MHIVIAGAGGVGGYFGARLVRAGGDVTFVARGRHLDALARDGLRVRSAIEGDFTVPVTAVDKVDGTRRADVVLLCVKSFDTETAVEAIRPVVGADTPVVTLQNGVDNTDKIDALLGPGHAVGGLAWIVAVIEAPGVITHSLGGRIIFGELSERVTPRGERFRDALVAAKIPAELSTDIRRLLWEKYIFMGAQAGMTALTRCRLGVVRDTPETWRMYRMIVEELCGLGRAAGVDLSADTAERTMKFATQMSPQAYTSLYHDLLQGRRLELETFHGHAVRLGQRLGVPTPMVGAVYAALLPHVAGTPT